MSCSYRHPEGTSILRGEEKTGNRLKDDEPLVQILSSSPLVLTKGKGIHIMPQKKQTQRPSLCTE